MSKSGLSPGLDLGSQKPIDGVEITPNQKLLLSTPVEQEPNPGGDDCQGHRWRQLNRLIDSK